jgi:tmRNA-binding protein
MTFNSKTNSIIMAFKLIRISRKLSKKKKEFDKRQNSKKKSAKSQHHNKLSEYLPSISRENYHFQIP